MAQPFFDSTTRRWVLRQKEVYKGEIFTVSGSSRKSKTEARENYKKNLSRKKAAIDGAEAKEQEKTLSQGLWEWYELYRRHDGRKVRTVLTDEGTIRQIETGSLGEVRIHDLTPENVQAYLNSTRTLSTSSIKKIWGMIRPFLIYIERDDITRKLSRPAGTPAAEKRAYTDGEMERLASELLKPYDLHATNEQRGYVYGRPLIACMYLFLRVGELVELRAEDLQGDFITVKRQYVELEHAVRTPKYGSSRRVPIPAEIQSIIMEAAEGKEADALLFPSGVGKRIREADLVRTLAGACKAAGLPRHTVHDLRHDGISRLVRLGVGVASVSRWAGHKSIETTLRRYYRDSGAENERDLMLIQAKERK